MDSKLKAKWVKALLSGNYEQGTGAMFNDSKYCCLGVLCDVAGWPMEDYVKVDRAIGIDARDALWRLNDREGMPFDVIAGLIQEAL